ncbi:hypothetical protein [Acidiphilium sp.]|uniref:hypothetical protein n=1 Tax=Acidiphilium sp. TaxID=527 RepID=UPI00258BBBAC|nr:hypothetical protein [Acidiphilium sp.]
MSNAKPAEDAATEIARLRAEIETLRAAAGEKAQQTARRAEALVQEMGEAVCQQSELVAAKIRERPLTALLLAGLAGFVIGRLARH